MHSCEGEEMVRKGEEGSERGCPGLSSLHSSLPTPVPAVMLSCSTENDYYAFGNSTVAWELSSGLAEPLHGFSSGMGRLSDGMPSSQVPTTFGGDEMGGVYRGR